MEEDAVEALRETGQTGNYWGHIEAVAPHVWRWPFSKMEHGDWFTVSEADRPSGGVRNTAYQAATRRRNTKFAVKTDGETVTVICLPKDHVDPSDRTLSQRAADKAILIGGDGDKYLGTLVPPKGWRWSWPFGTMEPGQYFHVDHEDRHPERVRQTAMLRAGQLAIRLSVCAKDPERPGYCRIEYVDITKEINAEEMGPEALDQVIKRYYGCTFNHFNVWHMQNKPWQSVRIDCPARKTPRDMSFVAEFDFVTFGIALDRHGITVTGLPRGTTYFQWLEHVALS